MRVVVNSIEDFCEEIREDPKQIVDGCIRVRVDKLAEQDEAVSFGVVVWATAIVVMNDGDADYVLEFSGLAGRDDLTLGTSDGTCEALRWIELVRDAAHDCGLNLRKGKIEVS